VFPTSALKKWEFLQDYFDSPPFIVYIFPPGIVLIMDHLHPEKANTSSPASQYFYLKTRQADDDVL
jgi:hypothetical protein